MKYCTRCGTQLVDEAVVCVNCGCAVDPLPVFVRNPSPMSAPAPVPASKPSELSTAAKVFMVIGTVIMGFYLIPLAWCIPMTVSYFNKVKYNRPISTGFKVCCLLFVSLIGGVLMLCDKERTDCYNYR